MTQRLVNSASSLTARAIAVQLAAAMLLITLLCSLGETRSLPASLAAWINASLTPALPLAAAYLLGGLGLGELLRSFMPRSCRRTAAIRGAMGLSILLWYSHALGMMGWLTTITAWTPIILGLWLLGRALAKRRSDTSEQAPIGAWWPTLFLMPLCLLAVASANAPGYLWDSEFGGYDALSYHLQLPQEWLAAGRITPLNHNVYSFLPGSMEAAFFHLGVMSFAPPTLGHDRAAIDPLSSLPAGLLADSGWRVLACQSLHSLTALVAAWCVQAACREGVERVLGTSRSAAEKTFASIIPAAIFLATPWTLVTASLAYDEMPMLGCFAAAAALTLGTTGLSRPDWIRCGVGCGVLIGSACGAKLTAITFCGVPTAILLLASCPPPLLAFVAGVGIVAGGFTIAPWLIRNGVHGGNPVFPFAASFFPNASGGTGHWTSEQVNRFHAGHHFQGSIVDALSLSVLKDQNDPAGPRHRGLLHPQWALFFLTTMLAIGASLAIRIARARITIALLVTLAAQMLLWLTTTHVQSRFLMPLMVPACMLMGIVLATFASPTWRLRIGVLATLVPTIGSCMTFMSQRGGRPNQLMTVTPGDRTGETQRAYLAQHSSEFTPEFLDSLGPEHAVNLALPRNARVTMIGGATPLFLTRRIDYATTWDAWTDLETLMEQARHADDRFALVNLGEIERLSRSGTLPPGWSSERVVGWVRQHTRPIKVWQDLGQLLVKITPDAAATEPTKTPSR